jgi:CheY-like chemotaxis protein
LIGHTRYDDGTPSYIPAPMLQRVLIVDSSKATRKMLELKLKGPHLEVIHAASANQALAKLHRQEISLITTAKALPDDHCSAFIAEIRQTPGFEDIPIIVLTGDEVDETTFDPDLRITRICQKSLGIAQLTECIRETLATSPSNSQILRNFMPDI